MIRLPFGLVSMILGFLFNLLKQFILKVDYFLVITLVLLVFAVLKIQNIPALIIACIPAVWLYSILLKKIDEKFPKLFIGINVLASMYGGNALVSILLKIIGGQLTSIKWIDYTIFIIIQIIATIKIYKFRKENLGTATLKKQETVIEYEEEE